jgi:hypothetical protein
MTRACQSCGSHFCDGVRCYLEDPPVTENVCNGCDQPWDANRDCPRCEQSADEQLQFERIVEVERTSCPETGWPRVGI